MSLQSCCHRSCAWALMRRPWSCARGWSAPSSLSGRSPSRCTSLLKKAENMPKDKLRMLDAPGSEHLIYEMRFLPVEARPPAAIYILDNNLSPAEATTLSRAIKDHERRNAWKEGFTDHPGDCLAYKYYRDAIEVRKEKEKLSLVEKGLAVAVSESAIEQLNKLVQEEIPKIASATRALLQIVRLTKEEVGFRPVPIVTPPA
eukprot:jgi/Botrbrau1/9453/Bobra.0252s0074.1